MIIKTIDDIDNLLHMNIISSAIGSALELGLFPFLQEKPADLSGVSTKFNIHQIRCHRWLNLLIELGLLECENELYILTQTAITTIMKPYRHGSLQFMAKIARDQYILGKDLNIHISSPKSLWEIQDTKQANWLNQILEDPTYARNFTITLYERHFEFANEVAQRLDMRGVNRILDLGGGSGVLSLAFLDKYPELQAVVMDFEIVCQVGRELALERDLNDRIDYFAGNYLEDQLPSDFDIIFNCDIDIFSSEFYAMQRTKLSENGRLIVLTNFEPFGEWLKHEKQKPGILWHLNRFTSSLGIESRPYVKDKDDVAPLKETLVKAGFTSVSIDYWNEGPIIIQAQK